MVAPLTAPRQWVRDERLTRGYTAGRGWKNQMQIDVFHRSVSDNTLSIGLAEHRGTHYRFIASNSDGKVVRLERG